VTSCKSTELLVKSTGSSVYDGVFRLVNTSYGGRPVFRHDRRQSLHLYYSPRLSCADDGAWVISDGLGSSSSTAVYAVDDAADPLLISPDATWFVYDRTADQFLPDSQLTLACYVDSSAAAAVEEDSQR